MIEREIDNAESDDQELSDFHKDFLMRYMEVEIERQERASASFLSRRASSLVPSSVKASHNQS
jgi:hypothetical protein